MAEFWSNRTYFNLHGQFSLIHLKTIARKIIREVGEIKKPKYNKNIKVQNRDERNLVKTPGHYY